MAGRKEKEERRNRWVGKGRRAWEGKGEKNEEGKMKKTEGKKEEGWVRGEWGFGGRGTRG